MGLGPWALVINYCHQQVTNNQSPITNNY